MSFSDFTPHGFCLAWDPGLIWLQALSDMGTAIAYYSIPAALLVFIRRRQDLVFKPVFALFAAFIVACGTTHLMSVVTLWVPAYWTEGLIKAVTALLSIGTAVVLWPMLPKALALPSPRHLREANAALALRIAERDAAYDQLRASEARLHRFYARTPAPLHATDAAGRLIAVSDRWLDLLGYAREEVLGRSIADFYDPAQRDEVLAMFRRFEAGSAPARVERRLRCKSGQHREVEAVFDIERDEAGGLQHVLVVLTDITARKQAEAALAASEERLRQAQKMEAVGQLTGGIAHDFNNLLTSILGSLDLLGGDASLSERGRRRVEIALAASRRAAELTSQLLSFSRKQRLAPQTLAPVEVVEGIRALLARTVGERIALEIEAEPAPWAVTADRNQLEAALLNLVINARDAIGGSGRVLIQFANLAVAAPEIEALAGEPLAEGDYVAITVEDDGAGMTEAVRARAFEPFFTTKPPGMGTGLGLSQTYGFARQSGGAVRLDSTPGAGTRATLLLPAARDAAIRPAREPGAAAAAVGQGQRILLAEDDPLLRATVCEALAEQGYRVTAAENADEALAKIGKEGEFALLFTDIRMPGTLDGVGLALAARQLRPDLRILFATGYSERAALDRWPEPIELLPKPFTLQRLLATVSGILQPDPVGP